MEHVHQLLEQSARDGGCEDFGKAITHLHYHPVILRPTRMLSTKAARDWWWHLPDCSNTHAHRCVRREHVDEKCHSETLLALAPEVFLWV